MIRINSLRYPVLALAILAALVGMWAGLARMGWRLSIGSPSWIVAHGPLMVSGFLGTLISLERVVALRRSWMYIVPVLPALGVIALILGIPDPIPSILVSLGSAGFLLICTIMLRMAPALFTVTMLLGSLAWLGGNLLWMGGLPVYKLVPWWIGFLALTIAAERLELSRITRPPRYAEHLFLGLAISLLAGMALSLFVGWGVRLGGAALVGLAVWLWVYDIARRAVRKNGITRFIAASLLCGYTWMGFSGLLALWFGNVSAGFLYDAMLHTFFLGFVFSMIFGHAPIVLTGILGVELAYNAFFYSHLVLLQLSLLLRVAGDLGGWLALRQWGGMLNMTAVILFLWNSMFLGVITPRKKKSAA